MKAYKLVRKLKDGNCYPLFIDKNRQFFFEEERIAECHITPGFAPRTGFHVCIQPVAPHLKEKLSNGEQYLKVDGVTLVSNTLTGDITNDFNLVLFGCNRDGTAAYLSKSRVYACKISTGNTLVRDYVPVKKLSNNEYGMYDMVTKQFFGNSGTGAFTGGPAVKPTFIKFTNDYYNA